MKIQSVHIRNYRKLKNCHIDFDEKKTVLVGANNSGKTSAISAIVWFLKNTDRFTLKELPQQIGQQLMRLARNGSNMIL